MGTIDKKERGNSETSVDSANYDASREDMSSRKIKKCLYICSFAFMMNFAAYGGLIFLQSSMNIENGLGTTSLFAIYATSTLSTILFVPFLIDFLGAKSAIVIGEFGIITYTIANFYPRWFTLIPAAIFHGLTESAAWAGTAVYITHLGEQYWKRNSKLENKREAYVYQFLGIFFVFVYMSQVVGNALVYLLFFGLSDLAIFNEYSLELNSTAAYPNHTFLSQETATNNLTWESCGSNECQSEYIYDEDSDQLEKYKPNQTSVYFLLGIFLSMQVIFTLVHAYALPRVVTKFENAPRDTNIAASNHDDEESQAFVQKISSTSPQLSFAIKSELKDTLRHIMSPLHLLVFPLVFYNGVLVAFNVTEFTRAYVSCTIGVEQVGLVIVVYAASSMVMSLLSSKLLPIFGRNVLYCIVFLLHLTSYFLCLLWQPHPDSTWMIYLLAVCLGSCDGTFANALQGMIAVYFQDKMGIAFSVKNFANNVGIVAGTGWSTSLCVYVKIYILMGLLLVSAMSYIGAECWFRVRRHEPELTKQLSKNTSSS